MNSEIANTKKAMPPINKIGTIIFSKYFLKNILAIKIIVHIAIEQFDAFTQKSFLFIIIILDDKE